MYMDAYSTADKHNESPQIARVKEVKEGKIKVEWFAESWREKWRLYKYKVGKKTAVWEEIEQFTEESLLQKTIHRPKKN